MDWLSRISVGAKLALVVGVLSAVVFLTGGAALWALDRAVGAGATLMAEEVPAVRTLGDVRAGIGNMRRFEKDLFLNLGDEAALARYHEAWRAEVAKGRERLTALRARLEPSERGAVDRMLKGIDGYARAVEAIVAGIRVGQINDPWAANKAMEPSKGDIRAADKAFEELTTSVVARMDASAAALQTLERRTQWALALTTFGGLALGLVLAWAVAGRITAPLREAVAALDRVAAGDLQAAVQPRGSDEPAQLLHGVRRMQQSLATMVVELRGGIETVAVASDEIARGNADLSARTEHQASHLQQTAASMAQIGGSARSGADSARQAHALAQQASAIATRGGGEVGEVVATMAEIEAASRRIGEITGVIDGIAFQTNILALNAAVEAARAGGQGRGFAVVAGEVRSLAQRSAEAARQIKALIGDSVARVDAGCERVRVAGRTIEEVVQQVGRVHALIGAITEAAGEQGQGIAEIGQAVGELDRTTQQNAALVEQTAAAAASLKQQAQRLAASVSMFRVEGVPTA